MPRFDSDDDSIRQKSFITYVAIGFKFNQNSNVIKRNIIVLFVRRIIKVLRGIHGNHSLLLLFYHWQSCVSIPVKLMGGASAFMTVWFMTESSIWIILVNGGRPVDT